MGMGCAVYGVMRPDRHTIDPTESELGVRRCHRSRVLWHDSHAVGLLSVP